MRVRGLTSQQEISASTVIDAAPERVYGVVSDIRRIPRWSPECIRADWIDAHTFRGTNARRFGRWSTKCRVITRRYPREFTFEVRLLGRPFTRWSYQIAPGPGGHGSVLTEVFTMCRDLPTLLIMYEVVALGVRDRRADLQGNLDQSVRTIKHIIESENR